MNTLADQGYPVDWRIKVGWGVNLKWRSTWGGGQPAVRGVVRAAREAVKVNRVGTSRSWARTQSGGKGRGWLVVEHGRVRSTERERERGGASWATSERRILYR